MPVDTTLAVSGPHGPANNPRGGRWLPAFAAVLALHVLALWLLHAGLLQRAPEPLAVAAVIAELIPSPVEASTTPPPSAPVPALVPRAPVPAPTPAPPVAARAQPQPAPSAALPTPPVPPLAAGSGTAPALTPTAAAPATATAAGATAPVTAAANAVTAATSSAAPPPTRVELPSSDADYLQNPRPPYPAVSKRLNEQGTVIMRVLIGADGLPQQAELRKSSGFERLDRAAAETVMKWRYVPGRRAGVAEPMWFNVPIHFLLE